MKIIFTFICCLILFTTTFALATDVEIGEAKARLVSADDSRTHVNFFVDPAPKTKIVDLNPPNRLFFKVVYQVQDDSRFAGASQRAYAAFKAYDLTTFKWIEPGQLISQDGGDLYAGIYNHHGTWTIFPTFTGNITRYYGRLYAKTKGHDKTRERIFYIANKPINSAITQIQQSAAPKWIANRYENAINMMHLREALRKMAAPDLNINFNAEMLELLVSTAGLIAPTTPVDYAKDSGMEILGLVTTLYTSPYIANAVSGASEIINAYQYIKWAQQTLQNSFNKFFDVYNSFIIKSSLDGADSLIIAMQQAANAMVAEGKALEAYVYSTNDPIKLSQWKAALKAERDAIYNVAAKSFQLEQSATTYFFTQGNEPYKYLGDQKVYPFLQTINKLALMDYLVLDKVVKTGGF
ncbi:MAG: hypothetical protein N3D15_06285 [Syntrophorhabdaceae bacterium]|nr:hypothetical protein [Syntrophorhabdaceae bacterium]